MHVRISPLPAWAVMEHLMCELFDQPPYSPDLTPSDYNLFTRACRFLSHTHTKKSLRGFSPRANYTDRTTAACWRIYTFADILYHVISPTYPHGFLDRSSNYFFQVAPQLYSRGWVNPVSDPLLLRKSGSAGNRARTSGSAVRNSDHRTTEAAYFLLHYLDSAS
jgi:hypothetical protein